MLTRLVRSIAPAIVLAALPVASFAGVAIGVSIDIAPPALPVYVQPAPPGPDYIWTPGYWAWGDDGYYWVPGTWVLAPEPGLLWTPGYWGWVSGVYIWHAGYWGPHVGFYGGVNYGCGYGGVGYEGAYWRGGHVVYNRAVTNVTNINVTNVYNKTVVVNNYSHVSFNGGRGGIMARATGAQLAAEHERHFDPTPMQRQHIDMAARDRDLRAVVNHGRPHIAATERPTSFEGHGVVAARAAGGVFHPAVNHAVAARPEPAHGAAFAPRNDRPPQAQREAAQRFAAAQHGEPPHGQPQVHNEPFRGSPAVHNESARSPIAHNSEAPRPRPEAPRPQVAPHSEVHNNFARQAPEPNRGGGQPNMAPRAQAPHPGGGGGGGRPEGRGGRGEPNMGQQNRFR